MSIRVELGRGLGEWVGLAFLRVPKLKNQILFRDGMLIDIGFYLGERKGKKDKKEKYATSFIELSGFRGDLKVGV